MVFEEHIQEAEHAAQRSDIGAVYRVINKVAPRRRHEKVRIRSASGAMLGPKEEFSEILQHSGQPLMAQWPNVLRVKLGSCLRQLSLVRQSPV